MVDGTNVRWLFRASRIPSSPPVHHTTTTIPRPARCSAVVGTREWWDGMLRIREVHGQNPRGALSESEGCTVRIREVHGQNPRGARSESERCTVRIQGMHGQNPRDARSESERGMVSIREVYG